MSAPSLIAALNAAWMIASPRGLALAVASPDEAHGLVTPIYSDRTIAEATAETQPPALDFAAHCLHNVWDAMQQVAAQGIAGFLLDDVQPLYFMTTSEGSELPTHLALPLPSGGLILDERGLSELTADELQPWRDPARFDRLAAAWLLGGEALPFVGYQADAPLYDYRPGGSPRPIADRGLLLDDSGPALALFSSAFAAEWYWENMQGVALTGAGEQAEQLAAHEEVPAALDALAAAHPDCALILNPGRHRFYQGFFRRADDLWFLVTINGVWRVDSPFTLTHVARRT